MVRKPSRVGRSLCGSETDKIIRPEFDSIILEKVQLRVDVMRCGFELGQGGEVILPSASGWVSGSMTLDLRTSGQEGEREWVELLTRLTCLMVQP